LKQNKSILEEEEKRSEQVEEEAKETDFCIKGYDYEVRQTSFSSSFNDTLPY